MAGIYLHIPFCVQRCHYCDFFSSTQLGMREKFVSACLREIELRSDYLKNNLCDTIYIGGGTPSLLDSTSLEQIISKANKHLNISENAEITIEANPDDINSKLLRDLKSIGFNRISLGIQSFRDKDLLLMNRRHTADQSVKSIDLVNSAGFDNLNIDLIYGIPGLKDEDWISNLEYLKGLPVNHLSAYHLTIEANTIFGKWQRDGRITEMDEEDSLKQYMLLKEYSSKLGFEHYEISNFAKKKQYSRHNMKYWTGERYLGIGPSAHSFNGKERHWNPSALEEYIKGYLDGSVLTKKETISNDSRRNELIMTRLRTMWGINRSDWEKLACIQSWTDFLEQCQKYISSKDVISDNDRLTINPDSWFRADGIIADLFRVDKA